MKSIALAVGVVVDLHMPQATRHSIAMNRRYMLPSSQYPSMDHCQQYSFRSSQADGELDGVSLYQHRLKQGGMVDVGNADADEETLRARADSAFRHARS